MTTKDRYQKAARRLQKLTGWHYTRCLGLSRGGVSWSAVTVLARMEQVNTLTVEWSEAGKQWSRTEEGYP